MAHTRRIQRYRGCLALHGVMIGPSDTTPRAGVRAVPGRAFGSQTTRCSPTASKRSSRPGGIARPGPKGTVGLPGEGSPCGKGGGSAFSHGPLTFLRLEPRKSASELGSHISTRRSFLFSKKDPVVALFYFREGNNNLPVLFSCPGSGSSGIMMYFFAFSPRSFVSSSLPFPRDSVNQGSDPSGPTFGI